MPTCEYCDQPIEPGTTKCPHCWAALDPARQAPPASAPEPTGAQGFFGGDATATAPQPPEASPPQAPPPQAPPPQAPPPPPPTGGEHQGASAPAPSSEQQGVGDLLQSLQRGDVGSVAQGLQGMASSGQLDVGKLAADLGVSGGAGGLDLGDVAKTLAGGGSGASSVLSALGNQGGGLSKLLDGASGALKGGGGLAIGGAALAAGAGLLAGKAGGGGLQGMLGSVLGGAGGGDANPLGAFLGGDQPAAADSAATTAEARALPPPSVDQLSEGMEVLARWDGEEFRKARVGWIDGGQARVTFDSGLEKWCEMNDLRIPGATSAVPEQAPPPPPAAPPPPPPVSATSLPPVGTRVQAEVGDNLWAPAEVLEIDEAAGRLRVRFDNAYECWMEAKKIVLGF